MEQVRGQAPDWMRAVTTGRRCRRNREGGTEAALSGNCKGKTEFPHERCALNGEAVPHRGTG